MGSTILNNVIIGRKQPDWCGTLVTEDNYPPNVLAFGRPEVIRPLTCRNTSNPYERLHYIQRAEEFRQQKYNRN